MNKRPHGRTKAEPESLAPPASLDTEKSVLGAMIIDQKVVYGMQSLGIKPDHFAFDSHRRIFRAIEAICYERKPLDMILICDELTKRKELEAVGDVAYISSLLDGLPDRALDQPETLASYFGILHQHHLRREVIHIADQARLCAYDSSDPVESILSGIHQDILRLQTNTSSEGVLVKELTTGVLDELTGYMYHDQATIGLPFGLDELDEVTTGMRKGEFIPVGGYPASGKTSFALDVARKVAKQYPVAFFSVEMPKNDLVVRLLAQESGISYAKLRNPKHLASSERRELDSWRKKVDELKLIVDDEARHINEIIPRAYLYIKRHGAKLVVVDFLQLVDAPGQKEYDIVSYTADALTKFAKKEQVPVLALSQLSRPEDKKNPANVIPNVGMLRSSGHIEQNANLALFTYHPEDDRGDPTGQDLIVIGKQRAGVKGHIKCYFNVRSQTWEERGVAEAPPQKEIFK